MDIVLIKRNKAFATLLFSSLTNTFGSAIYNIVLLVYAAGLPNPKLAVSIATIITTVPFLLQTFTGSFADKAKNKIRWYFWFIYLHFL
jgi:Na+/melibiose symporter-like transporter